MVNPACCVVRQVGGWRFTGIRSAEGAGGGGGGLVCWRQGWPVARDLRGGGGRGGGKGGFLLQCFQMWSVKNASRSCQRWRGFRLWGTGGVGAGGRCGWDGGIGFRRGEVGAWTSANSPAVSELRPRAGPDAAAPRRAVRADCLGTGRRGRPWSTPGDDRAVATARPLVRTGAQGTQRASRAVRRSGRG